MQLFVHLPCRADELSVKKYTLKQLDDLVKKNPKEVKWYLRRADFCLRSHGATPAIEDYQRVLQIDPHNMTALNNLAKLDMVNRRWEEAKKTYEVLVKLKPTAESFSYLGEAKLLMKDYAGTVEDWRKCAQLQPDVVPYLERRGFANFIEGDWSAAAKDFEAAFRGTKEATPWPIADACFAGLGYDLANRPEPRAHIIKDAEQKENSELDLFDLITLRYMQGKMTAAEYLKSRDDPYYVNQARFFIGFELVSQGKQSEALAILRQCDIAGWTPHDDQKLPLDAVVRCYLARTKGGVPKVPLPQSKKSGH